MHLRKMSLLFLIINCSKVLVYVYFRIIVKCVFLSKYVIENIKMLML